MIDFHNHLIPGVDDGARDLAAAREALRRFRAEGVEAIITTPHLDGSLTESPGALADRLAELDAGWQALAELAREEFPELRLERGAEVRLDTPSPDLSDARLRLAGGRFVLVEFAGFMVPPRSEVVLEEIAGSGFVPVLAHPERYRGIGRDPEQPDRWREAGVRLQVNHGSFLGLFGSQAREHARRFLRDGLVDYVSSDYHARGEPRVREARAWLAAEAGEEAASLLFELNPRRLLDGQGPLPVRVERQSLFERVTSVFRR